MEISSDLLCVFSARVTGTGDSFVVEIPEREVDVGDVHEGETYQVAMLSAGARSSPTAGDESGEESTREASEPPVESGDVVDVEIEDVGDQGDGIARVGPGYVVIVPETEVGERVAAEITDVRENVAFATVEERYDSSL